MRLPLVVSLVAVSFIGCGESKWACEQRARRLPLTLCEVSHSYDVLGFGRVTSVGGERLQKFSAWTTEVAVVDVGMDVEVDLIGSRTGPATYALSCPIRGAGAQGWFLGVVMDGALVMRASGLFSEGPNGEVFLPDLQFANRAALQTELSRVRSECPRREVASQ
jgi:hypothetical protein